MNMHATTIPSMASTLKPGGRLLSTGPPQIAWPMRSQQTGKRTRTMVLALARDTITCFVPNARSVGRPQRWRYQQPDPKIRRPRTATASGYNARGYPALLGRPGGLGWEVSLDRFAGDTSDDQPDQR